MLFMNFLRGEFDAFVSDKDMDGLTNDLILLLVIKLYTLSWIVIIFIRCSINILIIDHYLSHFCSLCFNISLLKWDPYSKAYIWIHKRIARMWSYAKICSPGKWRVVFLTAKLYTPSTETHFCSEDPQFSAQFIHL